MVLLVSFIIPSAGSRAVAGSRQFVPPPELESAALGLPVMSNVEAVPSATTIAVTWTTSTASSSTVRCGKTNGSYPINAVDNGTQTNETNHSGIVAGLSPLTTYYCQIQSTTVDGQTMASYSTATTTPAPPSTPITGLTVGSFTPYNAHASNMTGDTYYNCISNDNMTYLSVDDSKGFGLALPSGANQMIGKLTSESPVIGSNINYLAAYGAENSPAGTDHSPAKASGLYCLAGNIYMMTERVGAFNGLGGVKHLSGQIIKSPDHGATWDNFQNPSTYSATGIMTNPSNATMFDSATLFGASTFLMYGKDDGSLGYRVDNADAYVYVMGNDGYWNNGNVLYLARIPRAKMQNLNPADIQYYQGGDGNSDASWSGFVQNAEALLSGSGQMSEPAVQYVPSLNRYILFEWYYPNSIQASSANSAYSRWMTYEAPHPWGPWTLIDTRNWSTQGYYNPVPLQRTALAGKTMTILTTGNFNANWTGYPNLSTSFSYQMYTTSMQLQTDTSTTYPYTGPLDLTNVPSPAAAYSLRRLSQYYTGSAIRVMRWSDAAIKDIGFASSGDLDVNTLRAFCGTSKCSVSLWYNQVQNNGLAWQSIASQQPVIMQNGQLVTKGGANRPSLLWAPGSVGFKAGSVLQGSQLEAVVVGSLNTSAPAWSVLLEAWDGTANSGTSSLTNADLFLRNNLNNSISSIRKGAEADATSMQLGSIFWADAQYTGSRLNLYFGANPVASYPSAGAFGSKYLMIGSADDGASDYAMQGNMSELLVFPCNLPGAVGGALYSNQQSYYVW